MISKRIIDDTPQIAVIKDLTFAYAIKEHFERRGFSVYLGTDDNLALDIFEYDLGITDVSTDEVKNDSLYDLIITNDDMRKVLKVVDTKEESVYSEGEKRKLIKKIMGGDYYEYGDKNIELHGIRGFLATYNLTWLAILLILTVLVGIALILFDKYKRIKTTEEN